MKRMLSFAAAVHGNWIMNQRTVSMLTVVAATTILAGCSGAPTAPAAPRVPAPSFSVEAAAGRPQEHPVCGTPGQSHVPRDVIGRFGAICAVAPSSE
jgi:hypothetical protein